MSTGPFETQRIHAVSTPGGLARQFRVQYKTPDRAAWRIYGSYRDQESAETIMQQLEEAGWQARLIECRLCPAA